MEADTVQDTDCQGNEEAQMKPPSPPLLLSEQLQLIFELRELAEDQIFRAVCTSQRLDMLYVAYSNASPKRLCSTCTQPFVIPARAAGVQDDKTSPG
jgi:hypothetical protein